MVRISLFLSVALILSLPLWANFLPIGITAVCWLLASVMTAALAVWGESGARDFVLSIWRALREPERSRAEVLRALLALAEQSRLVGLQGLADVASNWRVLQRASLLIASVAESREIYEEMQAAQRLLHLQYQPLSHRLRWLSQWMATLAFIGGVWIWYRWGMADLAVWSLVSGLLMVLLLMAAARIEVIANAELACLVLAYEGAVCILQNNSAEFVVQSLLPYLTDRDVAKLSEIYPSAEA